MKEIEGLLVRYSPFLDWAQISVTNRCNLKCIHCYNADIFSKDELTLDELKDIFDQLADMGCLRIVITGGEPTLRRDFPDIIKYGFRKGFAIVLLTNGTRLDSKMVNMFHNQPVSVQVSLYGPNPEVYEKVSLIRGSFVKTMDALNLLKKTGINFWIAYKVMNVNWEAIHEIEDLAENLKIDVKFDFLIFSKTNGDHSPTKYRVTDGQLREIFARDSFKNYLKKRTPFSKEDKKRFIKDILDRDFKHCYINPEGKVYPSIFSDIMAGDLRKQSLATIWKNSEILNQLRTFKSNDFECFYCQYLNLCFLSFNMAYVEHRNVLKSPKECCRITKNFVKFRF